MQNLLAALDWSAPDGSGVTRGLNALGPEAFDNAARASLNQMSEFSSLLFRHMTTAEPPAVQASCRTLPTRNTGRSGPRPTAPAPGRAAAADFELEQHRCGPHGGTRSQA